MFHVGEEVLAPWLDDGFYYPAIVVGLPSAEGLVHLAYLDGDEGDAPTSTVRRGVFGPGVHISVNWKGKGAYYGGEVVKRVGGAVQMAYDDGDAGWATLSQCRIRADLLRGMADTMVACTFCGAALTDKDPSCMSCGAPRTLP